MLCDACTNIFRGKFATGAKQHHDSPQALSSAVAQHCYVCAKILDVICHELELDVQLSRSEVSSRIEYDQRCVTDAGQGKAGPFTRATIWNDSNWPNPYGQTIRLEVMGGFVYKTGDEDFIKVPRQVKWFGILPKNEMDGLILGQLPHDRTDAESTLNRAKDWLDSCRTNHSLCAKAQSARARILPSRLLEIKQSFHTVRVSLFYPSKATSHAELEYFTLSHCWGAAQFLKFSTDTEQLLTDGVRLSELPRTFQDAIFVALKLGAKYIWIDSLCVLQDSVADWGHESSLMGDIYAGGVCNIAAAGAPDSDSECFFERDPLLIPPCMVYSDWLDRKNEEYHLFQLDWWGAEMEKSPLLRRGWVVQERLLAPRVLYLNREQIGWQCYELDACETYPNGLPDCVDRRRMERHLLSGLPPESFPAKKKYADATSSQGPKDFWINVLKIYSECKLTKPRDKLVALSGIAKVMQRLLNDDYLAGLWRSSLPSQLLWYRTDVFSRPAEYRAPSWSWASVDGPIWLENFDSENTLVEIIDAQVSTPTGDKSGQVSGGFIRLRGPLTTMDISESFLPGMKAHRFFNQAWDDNITTSPTLDFDDPADHIHCLPIKSRRPDGIPIRCLLLQPTGLSRGQFRRYGIIEFIHTTPKAFENWTGWRNFQSHDWLEFEAFDGVDRFTISII